MLAQKKISISLSDLTNGYSDDSDVGGPVIAYNGKLNIRPAYQREFIYKDKQRNLVIDTVLNGFDLSKFTWGVSSSDSYELIDGQQRTLSICQFVNGDFSVNWKGKVVYYHNLSAEDKFKFDSYKIDVVVCDGTSEDKLAWFNRVNIAGELLTNQELRNAVYVGPWLEDAKRYFSKKSCVAQKLYTRYLKGTPIRQDFLETVLYWISEKNNKTIEEYMADHQFDSSAQELILYVDTVFSWVEKLFPNYRKDMFGLPWGILYNKYYHNYYSDADLKSIYNSVEELYLDEDVTSSKGIYEYVLSGKDENKVSLLSIRTFDNTTRKIVYGEQNGLCARCGKFFDISDMDAHHKEKWSQGGKTVKENCELLCRACHKNEH